MSRRLSDEHGAVLPYAFVGIDDLKEYTRNAKLHPDWQVASIAESIKQFGFTQPILADKHGVVAGHGRLLAARKLYSAGEVLRLPNGEAIPRGTVPVLDCAGWSDEKRRAYIIADNRLAETGWDYGVLAEELASLKDVEFDIASIGFDAGQFNDVVQNALDCNDAKEATEDTLPPAPKEPVTKLGDLWTLGKHRLLCGDSTIEADVARLMRGEKADMLLTDPPYGVSYVGGTKEALTIENDSLDDNALADLLRAAFDLAEAVCRPGAYWYSSAPAGPLHRLWLNDWTKRGILRQVLVWVKDTFAIGRGEYHYRHEPILFGWIPGKRHKNTDRSRSSVWESKKPRANTTHPTMKPVELWEQAVRDGSRVDDVIYDPFLGSGTSVIAAERQRRRCYGIEISPRYCDVIVARWESETGGRAVLEARAM